MKIFPVLMSALAFAMLASCASMSFAHAPARTESGILTDAAGMTLYIFDRDMAGNGKSACYEECAAKWKPFAAQESDAAADDYTVIERNDGVKQWAYKGKPLYLWIKDQKPGDQTGDGFNKVWHVAKP